MKLLAIDIYVDNYLLQVRQNACYILYLLLMDILQDSQSIDRAV